MIWPWSALEKLKRHIEWLESRDKDRLFQNQLRETIALKAMRDLAGAHKGIRRLKARIKSRNRTLAGTQSGPSPHKEERNDGRHTTEAGDAVSRANH